MDKAATHIGADYDFAVLGVVTSLLQVLHKNKTIHIDEVVAQFGGTMDFARAQHMETEDQQKAKRVIYDHIHQIAIALVANELQLSQSQSGGEGNQK